MSGQFGRDCSLLSANATSHCSISRSIASCAAVTSLASRSRTWRHMATRLNERPCVRRRLVGLVRFEITEQTRQSIDDYLRAESKVAGNFLFGGRRGKDHCLTTRQYARLVSDWIGSTGLDPLLFGTHSLRRTKATLIYRRTGNLRAVQLRLGHTKIESTVRYLGVEVDDAFHR